MLMVLNPLLSSLVEAAFFARMENNHPVLLRNPVYIQYKWSPWGTVAVFSLIGMAAGYTL